MWKYENGRAVKCKLECFDVEIDNKGKIYCKETYYRTCEDVYKFNSLNVNIRRYVCHSIDVRDLVILKEEGL